MGDRIKERERGIPTTTLAHPVAAGLVRVCGLCANVLKDLLDMGPRGGRATGHQAGAIASALLAAVSDMRDLDEITPLFSKGGQHPGTLSQAFPLLASEQHLLDLNKVFYNVLLIILLLVYYTLVRSSCPKGGSPVFPRLAISSVAPGAPSLPGKMCLDFK